MNKYKYNFYEKEGDIDDQISNFLNARPDCYIVEGPTLSNASLGQYEAAFVDSGSNIPGYAIELTKKYRG